MYAIFWDIDGTLLTTMKAGVNAFDEACREIVHGEIDWTRIDIRGFSDRSIARRVLDAHNKPSDEAAIDRLLRCYESHLPSHLATRDGIPLPGVVPILERLRSRTDVLSLLLTGNTKCGARAKLERYGLLDYFRGGNGGDPLGGFAEDGVLRDDIARAAFALAENTLGEILSPDRCFVIGDTPHDVSCGKAIGARTIAVAT